MTSLIGRLACRMGVAAALCAAGTLAPWTAPQLTSGAAWAQSFQFRSVSVEGNQTVDDATVLGYAQIPTGAPLSAGALNGAYQRIVNAALFERVELIPQGDRLVIRVQEYPVVSRISIEGNRRLDDEELLALVGSVPRRIYNPSQAEADAAAIAEAYEQRGRFAAVVSPRIIRRSGNRVDLVFEVAEGGVVEIERLSFVGNRTYSDRRLRRVLQTKQAGLLRSVLSSDTFVAERLQLDRQLLTDFYRSRGFIDFRIRDVSTEFSRERDAFFVQFSIDEGQRWSFGRTQVVSDIPGVDPADYQALSRIPRGQTYSPRAIQNAIDRMERQATRAGLSFLRVNPQIARNPRTLTLDVTFRLERGPRVFVERIDIEGNATTLDRVIRRQFRTVEGDPFNPREIGAAAERIRALGYFSQASVEAREGTSPDRVIVDVDVEEQPTGSLTLGGSYSTDSGVGVNIGYRERNFLGRGQLLSFDVNTTDNAESARIAFGEPYFLGRDLAFRVEAFYVTSDFDEANYNTRKVGLTPSVAFPVSENGRISLRYSISEDSILDVDEGSGTTVLGVTDTGSSPIIQSNEGAEIVSAFGYTYSWDNRRAGLDPETALVFRFGQDFAGLGGDAQYVKTVAEAGAQRAVLGGDLVLRGEIEGGAIFGIGDYQTRVTDRFFLGGSQLRGFQPLGVGPRDLEATNLDALGGNYYVAARAEAEFPLGLPEEYGITGGLFADAGSVWGLEETTGEGGVEVDDGFNLRAAVGVSLFWETPFGPLRFDWSEAVAKEDYDRTRDFSLSLKTEF